MVLVWAALMHCIRRAAGFRRRLNMVLLLAAVAGVLYLTVFSRESRDAELVLIPFYSFWEAKEQPEMYRSMLMNLFLFVPVGLVMPFALPQHVSCKIVITVVFAAMLSGGIEIVQYVWGLGRCEVDDVIMNALGAGVGACSFGLNRLRRRVC